MAKPGKHGTGWRIRWTDENGRRKSEVYDTFQDANFALKRHLIEIQEVERNLKLGAPPKKKFSELRDYYLEHYSTQKRNPGKDRTIVKCHLSPKKFLSQKQVARIHPVL